MKPLIVLLSVFIVVLLILKMATGNDDFKKAARIAMSVMLLFTAMGHFMFPEGMAMMIPPPIPLKTELVYFTAVIEMLLAVSLMIPTYITTTGWILIGFFIILFPANIYAAQQNLNYQTGDFDGPGLAYLWFRVPLQLIFIAWTYFSAVKK
ncbi:hypothetical protein D1013_11960 [Euzebyella marina]|uniref:DoxX family membrane protein n=1 Tax=Euzebyella marina TaxID=1761453 RepID=A0A3G2L716_9FLAO|nr:hypothetical protein [Euzebyella marina]AYN68038.1 hypothetical protein D1013_11960 [Euzebyella marina]